MFAWLEKLDQFLWGIPLLILILGVGSYISIATRFAQLRLFPEALCGFLRQLKPNGRSSSYKALCTALAATVGTGNLAGVAGAIAIGGPGAVFWMWICGIIGMGIKFAEATLAVTYRERTPEGEYIGGPMYMIKNGLCKHYHWLATVYCFFGVVASFGVGNATQINTVIAGINDIANNFDFNLTLSAKLLIGFGLGFLLVFLLAGGGKRISETAEKLVPIASCGYLLLGFTVLVLHFEYIPGAFLQIIKGALSPGAMTGGVVGSIFVPLRIGAARGVFTNEAGMGTAAIAHATAGVKTPVEQGLMGIIEVFLDTIVICTVTALVILCSGVNIPYGNDVGVSLTTNAFEAVCGSWVTIPLTIALCLFAVATVLGWGFYGARCAQFLFGKGAWKRFVLLQGVVVVLGACLQTKTVWVVSDILNGLMAIPNLIVIMMLIPVLRKKIRA